MLFLITRRKNISIYVEKIRFYVQEIYIVSMFNPIWQLSFEKNEEIRLMICHKDAIECFDFFQFDDE